MFPVNDKTFPHDIQTRFGNLHDLSNNCVIKEILPEFSNPIDSTTLPISQTSSIADEEIVLEGSEVSIDFPSMPSDRSIPYCSHEPRSVHLPSINSPTNVSTQTYSVVAQSSELQTLVKSTVTIQPIHHESAIKNFEVGQCSLNPELSSSDESSPHFSKLTNVLRKPN